MGDERPRGIHTIGTAAPDRVALIHDGAVTTYGELDAAASRVAQVLADAGVEPGDRVAVRLHNRPEVFTTWVGIARVGALVVPVSYRFTAAETRYLLTDSGAGALLHDADAGLVAETTADLDGVTVVHVEDPALDAADPVPPLPDHVESPVTWMNYTSGTTGRPKGIERDPPPPAREAPPQPFADYWGFGPDGVHLLCGPAYHTAPGAYAQMHLVEGGRVVIMRPFDAEECLRLIDEHGVTSSHMVPANFVRILDLPATVRDRYDLSSVERILHAAAPCPEPVKRQIMEVFPADAVWEYYGASEGMGTVISPEEWREHPGSVGKPFPGLGVAILDDDGEPLPPGEVGTIYLSAMPGFEFEYHDAPDKTDEAWRDGRFTVGDLGWVDEDGYLYIADRRTDLILRGGVNIYPAEVETALAEHAEVVDVAVIGLPDEQLGERVHAVVEPTAGSQVTAAELRRFAAERLADFKVPAAVELVDRLEREPNGKVDKIALREARTSA